MDQEINRLRDNFIIFWLWLSSNVCLLHNFLQKNKQNEYLTNFTVGVQNADSPLECIRLVFSAKFCECARVILDHSSTSARRVQSDNVIIRVWQYLLYYKLGLLHNPIHKNAKDLNLVI